MEPSIILCLYPERSSPCWYRRFRFSSREYPLEFTAKTLKNWTAIDVLRTIKHLTLLMNSAHDKAQGVCALAFFLQIPKVEWVQYADSAHMPFFEERGGY